MKRKQPETTTSDTYDSNISSSPPSIDICPDDDDDAYEEVLVIAQLENMEEQNILLNAKTVRLEDADSKNPILIVDDRLHFEGAFGFSLGTKIILTDKSTNFVGLSSKKLKFELVKIESRPSAVE